MTTISEKPAATSSASMIPDSSNFNKYVDLLPKTVTFADALSDSVASAKWNLMYQAAGLSSAGETKKQAYRMWVYITCCLNGTSRSGDYSVVDKLNDGTSVEAAVIPRILGRDIRKFFRANINMNESYTMLKTTGAMLMYPRFISRCAALGIGADEAFATADWLADCPHFNPLEAKAHEIAFNAGIARARRARHGQTLEEVEKSSLAETIRVNGPESHAIDSSRIDF